MILSSFHSPKPVLRMHTVCQRNISIPHRHGLNVADLKAYICQGKDLRSEEIQLLSSGKECANADPVPPQSYVLVRSTAMRCVEVSIKITGVKSKHIVLLSLPLNTRVSKLKSLLFKEKHTKWNITGQRLIASSKVMKDHHILGDYLFHVAAGKKTNAAHPLSIYLSQTIDSRAEMEIHVTLRNKQVIKFYFECGLPLYYAKDILHKQFAIPSTLQYCFCCSMQGMRAVRTDMQKCLLDYGILPSFCKVLHVTLVLETSMALSLPGVPYLLSPRNAKTQTQPPVTPPPLRSASPASVFSAEWQNEAPLDSKSTGTPRTPIPIPNPPSFLLPTTTGLKKVPDSKRKSSTCSLFGGMKRGFLSSSHNNNNNNNNNNTTLGHRKKH